jgi:hypothetical protein
MLKGEKPVDQRGEDPNELWRAVWVSVPLTGQSPATYRSIDRAMLLRAGDNNRSGHAWLERPR